MAFDRGLEERLYELFNTRHDLVVKKCLVVVKHVLIVKKMCGCQHVFRLLQMFGDYWKRVSFVTKCVDG